MRTKIFCCCFKKKNFKKKFQQQKEKQISASEDVPSEEKTFRPQVDRSSSVVYRNEKQDFRKFEFPAETFGRARRKKGVPGLLRMAR